MKWGKEVKLHAVKEKCGPLHLVETPSIVDTMEQLGDPGFVGCSFNFCPKAEHCSGVM